jgi:CHASE1-domain containing sensor protein
VAAIQKGIERNLEVLESVGGLYAASGKVERDDFRKFVQGPLSRHQEIQALSWNERVPHSDRASYEEAAQDWLPGFQVTEREAQGQMVRSRQRAEYYLVYYIEPLDGNEAAVGFDLGSNLARLQTLERARDTGEMVATDRIVLVQETGEQFGFLIIKPIYETPAPPETVERRRQDLKGFAVGVFRVGDMVEDALEDLAEGTVNIQLVDESSPADEGLLYLGPASDSDNPANEEQLKARGELHLRAPLEIPGRQWSLLITPTSEFLGGQVSWESWGVLAGGLLITALLVAYLITVINHGVKTQRLAAELATVNEGLKVEVTERKRTQEEIRKLSEERAVVDEVARVITSTLGIQHVYEEFAQQLGQLVDFDRVAMAVID